MPLTIVFNVQLWWKLANDFWTFNQKSNQNQLKVKMNIQIMRFQHTLMTMHYYFTFWQIGGEFIWLNLFHKWFLLISFSFLRQNESVIKFGEIIRIYFFLFWY